MASPTPKSILLLLLSLLTPFSTKAEISNIEIFSDSRPLILFEQFGFTSQGSVSIVLSEVTFSSLLSPPDPTLLGFFLLPNSNLIQTLISHQNPKNPNYCILSSPYILPLLTLLDLTPPPINSFNRTFPVSSPDEYSLFFANCGLGISVSMSVLTSLYNTGPDGKPYYLSVGKSPVPTIYFLASILYLSFFLVWIYFILSKTRNPHRIHRLMAGLLLVKSLNLVFAAETRHYVRITGRPHEWGPLLYLFHFIKLTFLFAVIALIGTGWSFMKPSLHDPEMKVLKLVIPLQVVTNVAFVTIGDWVTWRHVLLLIDFVCFWVVLFPVVWSIRSLRETSKTDGKAARNLGKLLLFRKFYVAVIGYLYFTRVVMLAIGAIVSYEYRWVNVVMDEAVGLAFYIFVFYMFRPKEKNEYFALDDVEEAAAMVKLGEVGLEL